MFERERPVAQRADHWLGDGGVVIGHVLLGDAVARVEDAIGVGEVDLGVGSWGWGVGAGLRGLFRWRFLRRRCSFRCFRFHLRLPTPDSRHPLPNYLRHILILTHPQERRMP